MEKNRILFASLIIISAVSFLRAQDDAKSIYEGNQLYLSGKYPQSSTFYSRALEANANNKKANFNLGASLYQNAMAIKNGNLIIPGSEKIPADSLAGLVFDQAAQNFAIVANSVSDKDTLHRAWHNIGNCYLQKKDYEQAVTAYKKALKFDSKDEETRYNLAYALKHMPPKKGGGGGGGQQQQQQKKEPQQKKDQQGQMNKQQAEQILKALMDSERKLQDRRKQKQEDPSQNQVEKDW